MQVHGWTNTMITIEGLNKKQVAMLDKLWSIDTTEGIKEYRNTLCSEDQHMVDTLMEIIVLEMIDEEIVDVDTFPEVEKILKNLFKTS